MTGTDNRLGMCSLRAIGAIILGLALVLPEAVVAGPRAPTIIVVPGARPVIPGYPYAYPYAQTLGCWSDVRLFNTLRNGNFPYCRQNLRYRPGALECFQITEQVCEVIPIGATLPILTTSPVTRQVIPCPDGPEPPVCRRLNLQ